MKLLFVHDHPFFAEESIVYSGGGLPAIVWNNYLTYFEGLTVIGRNSFDVKNKKVVSSLDDRVVFKLIDKYSSISNLFRNYSEIKNEITDQVLLSDIVLARLPSVLGFIAARIAINNNKPLLVEQVGNAQEALSSHKSILGKLSASLFNGINKYMVRKADYVIYVTERKLQNDYKTKAKTVAISNVILPNVCNRDDIDTSRFYRPQVKIGLIGGFDSRYKGQDILLKAISILSPSVKDKIELYFIGVGDYTWLMNIAKELNLETNIKFIGSKQAGQQIFNFLSDLTLYVQPSFTEGMPRALLEGMSVGCPALASQVGGIPDLLESEFLHKAKDYKRLSQQIHDLYIDRDELLRNSYQNLEKARPYLKETLQKKRQNFFRMIIKDLENAKAH